MSADPDVVGQEERIHRLLPKGRPYCKPAVQLVQAIEDYARAVLDLAVRLPAPSPPPGWLDEIRQLARRPVSIVGVQRSGTTLMRRLLDGHPELAIVPAEGRYLTGVYPRLRNVAPSERTRHVVDHWIPRLINPGGEPPYWLLGRSGHGTMPYVELAANALSFDAHLYAAFREHAPFEPYLVFLAALWWTTGGSRPDAPRFWVDKSPLEEFSADEVDRAFPEARFIHVLREPAAVFASRKRIETDVLGKPPNAVREAVRIRRSFRRARTNRDRFGPDRYHVVRYEDLISDVDRTMESVRSFLGIREDPLLRVPTSQGQPVASNSSFAVSGVAGQIEAPPPHRHLGELDRFELLLFRWLGGRHAARFGYKVRHNASL